MSAPARGAVPLLHSLSRHTSPVSLTPPAPGRERVTPPPVGKRIGHPLNKEKDPGPQSLAPTPRPPRTTPRRSGDPPLLKGRPGRCPSRSDTPSPPCPGLPRLPRVDNGRGVERVSEARGTRTTPSHTSPRRRTPVTRTYGPGRESFHRPLNPTPSLKDRVSVNKRGFHQGRGLSGRTLSSRHYLWPSTGYGR